MKKLKQRIKELERRVEELELSITIRNEPTEKQGKELLRQEREFAIESIMRLTGLDREGVKLAVSLHNIKGVVNLNTFLINFGRFPSDMECDFIYNYGIEKVDDYIQSRAGEDEWESIYANYIYYVAKRNQAKENTRAPKGKIIYWLGKLSDTLNGTKTP